MIKYNFIISSNNYGALITNNLVTDSISYGELTNIIYGKLRNFNKEYNIPFSFSSNTNLINDFIIKEIIDKYSNKEIIDKYSNKEIEKEYKVYIYIEDYKVYLNITNKNYDYIYDFKVVIINDHYYENCVSNFCEKAISTKLEEIQKYYEDLKSRSNQRIKENNYHNSLCYEQDFSQICKIKELSKKLLELCNRELQNLSYLKYTE